MLKYFSMSPYSKQDVPSANYEMHAIHCKRFLTTCSQCGESVNKNQIQEHNDENHAEVSVFLQICNGTIFQPSICPICSFQLHFLV